MSTLADTGPAIEDFQYDELILKGYANEVCSSQIGRGSSWTFWEIVDRFGGQAGTMNVCRERWDAANDPDCNGTVASPGSRFYSTCWSNHATGRAIDIMVGGSASSGYNRQRGINIVNWLLTTDTYGNANMRARRLGIQQILFADRCWNAEGDRRISSWSQMRPCGIGHFDHVHIDLTHAGAAGNVSYWGSVTPTPAPKPDTQALFDFNSNWRQAVSWRNYRETDEEGTAIPAGYTHALACDCDGDGVTSEVLLWNPSTRYYIVQEWTDGNSLNARMGRFSYVWTDITAGDFDQDGKEDDMVFWDNRRGIATVQSWSAGWTLTSRWSTPLSAKWDEIWSGDFNGNGNTTETVFRDKATGDYAVYSWHNCRPWGRSYRNWPAAWDELIVGDFDAQGGSNETILWDRDSGAVRLQQWNGTYAYRAVSSGTWPTWFDIAVAGDFDSDGRRDDVFLYDDRTGSWQVYSYHRLTSQRFRMGTWNSGFDTVVVGSFNE